MRGGSCVEDHAWRIIRGRSCVEDHAWRMRDLRTSPSRSWDTAHYARMLVFLSGRPALCAAADVVLVAGARADGLGLILNGFLGIVEPLTATKPDFLSGNGIDTPRSGVSTMASRAEAAPALRSRRHQEKVSFSSMPRRYHDLPSDGAALPGGDSGSEGCSEERGSRPSVDMPSAPVSRRTA